MTSWLQLEVLKPSLAASHSCCVYCPRAGAGAARAHLALLSLTTLSAALGRRANQELLLATSSLEERVAGYLLLPPEVALVRRALRSGTPGETRPRSAGEALGVTLRAWDGPRLQQSSSSETKHISNTRCPFPELGSWWSEQLIPSAWLPPRCQTPQDTPQSKHTVRKALSSPDPKVSSSLLIQLPHATPSSAPHCPVLGGHLEGLHLLHISPQLKSMCQALQRTQPSELNPLSPKGSSVPFP